MDIKKLIQSQNDDREKILNAAAGDRLNQVLADHDHKILSFTGVKDYGRTWPAPIRKRVCTK